MTPARANEMTVFSCHDPAGDGLGHDGWVNMRTADDDLYASDSCAAGGAGSLSLELAPNGAGYANAARTEWVFLAPPWGSILAYRVDVLDSYAMPWSGSGEGQAFIAASDESDPNYDYRNLADGSLGAQTITRTPPTPDSSLTINASCDGQTGSCPGGPRIARIDVSLTEVTLADPTSPALSGLTGTLISGKALTGTANVDFNAADDGPGIYSGWLTVDGQPLPASVLDSNGGWCEDLGQTTNGTRSFSHPDPCLQDTSGTLALDTTGLADGLHTVSLSVDDASGNATTGMETTITTLNAPLNSRAPTLSAPGGVQTGATVSAEPGAWSAPGGAGAITYGYQWQGCDATGTTCSNIPAAQSATYTPTVADVGHALRALVSASDRDGLTLAATAASGPVPAPPAVASQPSAGVSNGSGASETARIELEGPRTLQRRFQSSAMRLRGRLVSSTGKPIADASLDVLARVPGSPEKVLSQTISAGDGTFSVDVAPGPSRIITIGYRAFSLDARYSATASVREAVSAQVTLRVTPGHTTPEGTITLSGRVAGTVPRSGVIVELLVRYRGQWEPFRTPRSDRLGRFRVSYRFQGAEGRFPFRAEVPAAQAGFPYAEGLSTAVTVNSG